MSVTRKYLAVYQYKICTEKDIETHLRSSPAILDYPLTEGLIRGLETALAEAIDGYAVVVVNLIPLEQP